MKDVSHVKKEIIDEWDEAVKIYKERKQEEKIKEEAKKELEKKPHSTFKEKILEYIKLASKDNKKLYATDISRELKINRGNLSVALIDLEKESKIKRIKEGRSKAIEIC